MKPRITVVGSINMDLVFRTPRMPVLGETITGEDFRQIPGGKGANQAVAAARQGADVRFVGAVGGDGFGHSAMRCLVAEGIDITAVTSCGNASTGVAGILVDGSGGNSIVLAPGANELLSVAQIEQAQDAVSSAQYLICQLETPMASVERAIELAAANGVTVVFNPAPAQPLADALLARVDYLIVNETEARQISGIEVTGPPSAQRAAETLRARGAGAVLLTMGEHGVCVVDADGSRCVPAIAVDVVDTTAAGDTFVGAFTVGLARGLAIDDAVAEAQYCA
ncbi:MAG TPA: ribokinase, partial [Burkholderiaceae bacterium]